MLPAAARDRPLAAVQIAWADAASCAPLVFFFYRRPVLHTGHIKPAERSRLANVRRGACESISLLSLTHHRAPLISFQSKYGGCVFFGKMQRESVRKAQASWGESGCRGVNLPRREAKLSLQLPLWRQPWESRKDNGSRLISLFGLLV